MLVAIAVMDSSPNSGCIAISTTMLSILVAQQHQLAVYKLQGMITLTTLLPLYIRKKSPTACLVNRHLSLLEVVNSKQWIYLTEA